MKLLICFFSVFLASCAATAKPNESSGVPVSINKIETHKVNGQLVRIIKHNTELEPKLELELFQPPEMQLNDYLRITGVKTPEREYLFQKSDGVFVEDLKVNNSTVEVTFEYYVPKGDAVMLICKIPVAAKRFDPIVCSKI